LPVLWPPCHFHCLAVSTVTLFSTIQPLSVYKVFISSRSTAVRGVMFTCRVTLLITCIQFLLFIKEYLQARFYVGARGNWPPKPKPCPPSPNLWLQQQYAVVKPANSYSVSLEVGVVDFVVWPAFSRAMTKKGRQLFDLALPPNIFL